MGQSIFNWQIKLTGLKILIPSETIQKIIGGLLLSLPALLVLVALFSSADKNFQEIFIAFFDKLALFLHWDWLKNLDQILTFIIQSGLFWLYLCLVFPYKDHIYEVPHAYIKHIVEEMTLGGVVAGVFALFIVTQFKSVNFILEGFTTGRINPGAFVREGFFQLLIACIIGLGVFHFLKRDLPRHLLTLFLLLEIFLVSLVAGERVWLYQYQFGFTHARIWGILFLSFLLILIFSLFLNLKNKIDNYQLWQASILSFSLLILLAGILNIDSLIANFRPPLIDGKVDTTYLATRLSWDAADYWVNKLNSTDNPDAKYALLTNFEIYLARLENHGFISGLDIPAICTKKNDNWLTENISVSANRQLVCENYGNWLDFKENYEKTHNIAPELIPTLTNPALPVILYPPQY